MFALGTDSFVVAGVLPGIARAFDISIGAAGQMASIYSITFAVLSPPIAALLRDTGLVSSMNEARRAIADGGAYVNNERVTDPEAVVPSSAFLQGKFLVLRRGKRNFAGVELLV